MAVAFIVGGLTSMGMPGLSGFIAEFPIFQGMWAASENISLSLGAFQLTNYYSVLVVLAAIGYRGHGSLRAACDLAGVFR